RIAHDLRRGIGIGTAITKHAAFDGDDFSITGCAPFRMNRDRMALMMAAYRFLTAPDDFDRTAQFPRCQRQDDLNRNIFASDESAAYWRVNNADLLVR